MATTVTWKDVEERVCVATITDGQGVVTALTPADAPFMTQIDDDDDLFSCIRSGSGYIRVVVDDVNDVNHLIGSRPLDRMVTVRVNGTLRWKGFLSCESFSQTWDRGPLELELPVASGLEMLHSLYPPHLLSDLGYISFAKFLSDMDAEMGYFWDYFCFPNISDPMTTLGYVFSMMNYATATDKNTAHEVSSYFDILEDICKLFGWQVVEYESSLVFLAADVKQVENGSNMIRLTEGQLRMIGTSSPPSPEPLDFDLIVPTIWGDDHSRSFLAGKKSVETIGQMNERDEVVWEMNVIGQCSYRGYNTYIGDYGVDYSYNYRIYRQGAYTRQLGSVVSTVGNILAYNSIFGMDHADTDGNNIKYHNMLGGSAYGGSVTSEMLLHYEFMSPTRLIGGSWDYVDRIITKANDSSLLKCVDINTNYFYTPTQSASTSRFRIEANIKTADGPTDIFVNAPNGFTVEVALMIVANGVRYYYAGPRSGGWTTTSTTVVLSVHDNGELYDERYFEVPTNISGQLVLRIFATTDRQGTKYVSWEGIKITQLNDTRSVWQQDRYVDDKYRMNINQRKIVLSNGFTDTWSNDCGLTLAREVVPDCYGIVLNANKARPASLYDGKWPEDALAERASAYFSQGRQKIDASVRFDGKLLEPWNVYQLGEESQPYVCMAQTVNWKECVVKGCFYEPTYNE